MALSWNSFALPFGSKVSDALEHFLSTVLPTLTHWQNKGGAAGATVLFDNGKAGGLLERAVPNGSEAFAWYFAYDPSGAQVDKFGNNTYNPATNQKYDTAGHMAAVVDVNGAFTANKTAFFGGSGTRMLRIGAVVGGPFERGETVTLDPGGLNLTATVVDHLVEIGHLAVSGLSGTWTAAALETKNIQGGTSGASSTITTVIGGMSMAAVDTYDLRTATTFPEVAEVLTGQTSGVMAEVATIDEATGRITVTNATGRFSVNETVEWNGGTETAIVGWAPQGFQSACAGYPTTDFQIDSDVVIYGEDSQRLILLIPNTNAAEQHYLMFAAGQWVESLEGGGRRETAIATPAVNFGATGTNPQNGTGMAFVDHNGVYWGAGGENQAGQILRARLLTSEVSSMALGQTVSYWGYGSNPNAIERAVRLVLRDAAFTGRKIVHTPELFFLPTEPWKTVASPGTWVNREPLALYLNDRGLCIGFDSTAITP